LIPVQLTVCAQHATMPTIVLYQEEDTAFGAVMNLSKNKTMLMIMWSRVKPSQIKNGKWKEFNKHAVLIAEGFYVNNKKHGTWRQYYDQTGTIMIEEDYKHGIQHGRYASFHLNGQLLSEGQFVDGMRQGYFRVYDEDGNNIRNLFFVDNIEIEGTTEQINIEERAEGRNGAR
jgi:antitoxin component YwqK of YwqJK toxin-antitoxin module